MTDNKIRNVQAVVGDKHLIVRNGDAVGSRIHRPDLAGNSLILEKFPPCLGDEQISSSLNLSPHVVLRDGDAAPCRFDDSIGKTGGKVWTRYRIGPRSTWSSSTVDAYDSGLERHLSPEERAAVPLVLARTPLKSARHLTQV